MRKWTFRICIEEGCDEFWEGLTGDGIEEIQELVEEPLSEIFGKENIEVKLTNYISNE